MTVTILRPFAVLVTLVGRGYGNPLDAATKAAKHLADRYQAYPGIGGIFRAPVKEN